MSASVALGLFDGVHLGHRRVISQACDYAQEHGITAAVCTFDTSTLNTKGEDFAPIYSDSSKAALVKKIGAERILSLDFAKVKGLSPEDFFSRYIMDELEAEHIVCGRDFRFGRNAAGNTALLEKLCAENSMTLNVIDDVSYGARRISSAQIRKFLREGNMISANELLGDNYIVSGEVVHGRHLGTKMGYPTANILFQDGMLLPRFGVYAVWSEIDGKYCAGAANIGIKPTVGSPAPLCEAHFFGYSGDLYGRELTVHFEDFVRPEQKFESVDKLTAQIAEDSAFILEKWNVLEFLKEERSHNV